ncbi:MAG TPA: CBS domain-containing protein [Nitrospiraceae bacterium]|nr:CBS domain-containing protein [Nitrospiraceae bacterium]
MQKSLKTRLARGLFVERDIERFQQQLARFQPLLSRRSTTGSLEEFDLATERLIGRVFGETSELLEAYEYAKLGEAASLVNLPEEAQESGVHDVPREALHQRKRVLESCISELDAIRSYKEGPNGPRGLAWARVADYMSHDVRSVHKDATIKEAGRLLQKWKVGSLLVDDGLRYIGIITDTDLSRKAVARGLDPLTTTVKTCMSKPVVTIEDNEPITAAISLMKQKAIRHLAVTEDGTIIGILSVSDLLRAYSELAGLTLEGEVDE